MDFKDSLKVETMLPMNEAAKLFVDCMSKYYNHYIDSLRAEIKRLEQRVRDNDEYLVKQLLMREVLTAYENPTKSKEIG